MQKYLIMVNVDLELTGFVPVPECFKLGKWAKLALESQGWAALVGGLAFTPDEEELAIGKMVVDSLRRDEVDIRD